MRRRGGEGEKVGERERRGEGERRKEKGGDFFTNSFTPFKLEFET